MKLKYIMTLYSPIIFNECLLHCDIAEGVQNVESAGFVKISWNPTTGFECQTYGESASLQLMPSDKDAERIERFLNNQSI
jgi:hypothetical protein